MAMRECLGTLALLFLLSCTPDRYAGDWTLCLTDSLGRRSCSAAVVHRGRPIGNGLRYSQYHRVAYDLPLDSLAGTVSAHLSGCGSLLTDRAGAMEVQLGLANCASLFEADGGNIVAAELQARGDTLTGAWHQSCYAACPASGALTMVRHP